MIKIIKAFMLLILSCLCLFAYYFLQANSELMTILTSISHQFIGLASTVLFVSLVLRSRYRANIAHVFVYIVFIIALDFSFKNLIPINTTTDIKKGIIVPHPVNTMSFGNTIKIENGIYQVKNITVSSEEYTIHAEKGLISTNQLILSNVFNEGQRQTTLELPMTIDMDVLFPLWHEPNFQKINALQGILYYNQLEYFHKGILLAIGQFLIYFLVLLIVGGISLAAQNTVIFTIPASLGITASYFSIYFLTQLLIFYSSAIYQAIIVKILS